MPEILLILLGILGMLVVIGINVTQMATSIIILQSGAFNYGTVIKQEANAWGQGAIIDMITSQQECPNGYEKVTGQFPGTKSYC